MQQIANYFETISSLHRTLILWGGLSLFYILEYLIPLIRFNYKKLRHAGVNIFFTLTTMVINFLLAFIIERTTAFTSSHHFGAVYLIPLPLWAIMLEGVLLLDLIGAYAIHYIEHKIKWMWKFHLIHHADTHVDTTTANRHHPGESVFRFFFTWLAVFIVGAPFWIVMLYQSISVVLSQFNHANIKLPAQIDTFISFIFVSPNMHKVHHHYVQPYTDSNYGNIFSIWDRLFGTFKKLDPSQLIYGIDTHLKPEENAAIGNLLAIPFQPYRVPEGSKFGK